MQSCANRAECEARFVELERKLKAANEVTATLKGLADQLAAVQRQLTTLGHDFADVRTTVREAVTAGRLNGEHLARLAQYVLIANPSNS
jgi:uncharacterized coiled-coil protein SlyX